jgi:hypothetical protein
VAYPPPNEGKGKVVAKALGEDKNPSSINSDAVGVNTLSTFLDAPPGKV